MAVPAEALIALLPLAGAFCLGIGALLGHWLRGQGNDPVLLQALATNSELLVQRKARQIQVEDAASAVARILREPLTPSVRVQLEVIQRRLVEGTTVE